METLTESFERAVLLDTDTDIAGKVLRALTFPGEGFGCYETFVVRTGAVKWTDAQRTRFWQELNLTEDDDWPFEAANMGDGYTYRIGDVAVRACWYWDGDGTLAFHVRVGDDERKLVNTDCKKDYNWREVE